MSKTDIDLFGPVVSEVKRERGKLKKKGKSYLEALFLTILTDCLAMRREVYL
jgi:hypothetical protein